MTLLDISRHPRWSVRCSIALAAGIALAAAWRRPATPGRGPRRRLRRRRGSLCIPTTARLRNRLTAIAMNAMYGRCSRPGSDPSRPDASAYERVVVVQPAGPPPGRVRPRAPSEAPSSAPSSGDPETPGLASCLAPPRVRSWDGSRVQRSVAGRSAGATNPGADQSGRSRGSGACRFVSACPRSLLAGPRLHRH